MKPFPPIVSFNLTYWLPNIYKFNTRNAEERDKLITDDYCLLKTCTIQISNIIMQFNNNMLVKKNEIT